MLQIHLYLISILQILFLQLNFFFMYSYFCIIKSLKKFKMHYFNYVVSCKVAPFPNQYNFFFFLICFIIIIKTAHYNMPIRFLSFCYFYQFIYYLYQYLIIIFIYYFHFSNFNFPHSKNFILLVLFKCHYFLVSRRNFAFIIH